MRPREIHLLGLRDRAQPPDGFLSRERPASFLSHEESESVLEDTPAPELAADLRLDRKARGGASARRASRASRCAARGLLLQQEGEMSIEQIAAATGVGPETAKSRLRYAVAKLRASLGKES